MKVEKVQKFQMFALHPEHRNVICFSDGSIWKLTKVNQFDKGSWKEVKQTKWSCGYLMFSLNGKPVSCHRIIYEAFSGEIIPKGMQVNHIDEIKTNNNINNLEICDAQYNNNYGTRIEKTAEKLSKPVNQFTKEGVFVKRFPSLKQAGEETGIPSCYICACLKRKQKTAYGFIWRYVDED